MTDHPTSNITLHESRHEFGEEVIRLDKEGFHYRGQFIADAGEAHRLMVEFLRQNTQPELQGPTEEELLDLGNDLMGDCLPCDPDLLIAFARAVLARWGRPAIEPVEPTEEELDELFTEIDQSGESESWRSFARAVLARWGANG